MTMKASLLRSILVVWICMVIKVSCIDTLEQGESLNWSSQLESPNGFFTLRFYIPDDAYRNSSYIAVLYNGGEDASSSSAVWIGNRDEPLSHNSTPELTLGTAGDLTITSNGDPIHLFAGLSQPSPSNNITATLLDTGNFVIRSNGNGGEVLWQSYDHPTDTLLPGMRLGKITSWLMPSNPASGAFTLEWDPSPGELLIRRRGRVYWRSGHLKDYYSNYEISSEGGYFMFQSLNYTSHWRLDHRGRIMVADTTTTTGNKVLADASKCYGYNNEISDNNSRGCQLWEQPECRNRHHTFDRRSGNFRRANGTRSTTFVNNSSSLGQSDCRDACWSWNNCECIGYETLQGLHYGCRYWIGKDWEWVQDLQGALRNKYVLQSSLKEKRNYIGIIFGVVSGFLLLILGLTYLIMRNRKVRREREHVNQLLTLEGYELQNRGPNTHHLKHFTYASIMSATTNFSSNNKLGEGGFGPVYKGRTAEGQDIAVKRLSKQSGQGLVEFKNELILISELQHVNLVKLLGFCIHRDDKMIIYDYMPNKSLDCFLFSPSKREQLDWQKRFNIIEGTAQGLVYLHKHSRLRIIHRDMKPNNVLLDQNMTPKISDFGLARIFKENASQVNTERRVGTYGYMAPEYAMQGIFSVKSDVYIFGGLVLEIVSGRTNSSFHATECPLSIVEYAWELWRKDCAVELMDPMLRESCVIEQLQKCIHIGLLCVENHAVDRPNIEAVLLMLKNETATLPMPTNPSFITRNNMLQQVGKATTEKSSSNEVINLSANQVTLYREDRTKEKKKQIHFFNNHIICFCNVSQ